MNSGGGAPAVGGLDCDSIQGADAKKRNKLGYHRTAVACGESSETGWYVSYVEQVIAGGGRSGAFLLLTILPHVVKIVYG